MVILEAADPERAIPLPPGSEPLVEVATGADRHVVIAHGTARLRLCVRHAPGRPAADPSSHSTDGTTLFTSLSDRLAATFKNLRGKGRLSEADVDATVREIRTALLEADVNVGVVRNVLGRIREQAVGARLSEALDPSQQVIKIVNNELTAMLGGETLKIHYASRPPTVVLMAGLQGSGKTTSTAKLARWFKRQGRQPLLVGADLQRPAAVEQLRTLGRQIDVPVFSEPGDPVATAKRGLDEARRLGRDVLIVDTAGRLAIDEAMMAEIKALHGAVNPVETLFVVDAMTGQDAANTAKAFSEALPLTGVVLTKTDGDARGGAALSVRYITGRPIKFIGTGEKADGLDVFHPDRVASRILDMGDVLSLVEQVEQQVDKDKAAKLAEKVVKGKKFDLNDMKDQLEQMQNMGGLHGLMDKLPGMGQIPDAVKNQVTGKEVLRMIAIINSMTKKERRHPDLLNGSRRARIARGAGLTPADVNRLMKQYQQMEKMMSKLSQGGMKGLMRGMKGMMGGRGGMPFR